MRGKKSSSQGGRRLIRRLSTGHKKTVVRPSKKSFDPVAGEKAAALAALKIRHDQEIKRLARTFAGRKAAIKTAVKSFRTRRADRGQIVFVGVKGGRDAAVRGRKGYAVYVTKTGKKRIVRQLVKGRITIPQAKHLSSIDVSRSPGKAARKKFLTAKANKVAAGVIKKIPASKKIKPGERTIKPRGTIYAGDLPAKSFYSGSTAVDQIAGRLKTAINSQKSKKTFLVTVGLVVKTKDGQHRFFSTQRRINRQDYQRADAADLKAFLARECYSFLAKELSAAGLVTSGSARHIAQLKGNKGKPRRQWRKGGFLWQGHDHQDCQVVRVEYRIDHLTFEK